VVNFREPKKKDSNPGRRVSIYTSTIPGGGKKQISLFPRREKRVDLTCEGSLSPHKQNATTTSLIPQDIDKKSA